MIDLSPEDDGQLSFFGHAQSDGEKRQNARTGHSRPNTKQQPRQFTNSDTFRKGHSPKSDRYMEKSRYYRNDTHTVKESHKRTPHLPALAEPQESSLLRTLVTIHWASRNLSLQDIQQGLVAVNGKIVTEPNALIHPIDDIIEVAGHRIFRKAVKPVTIVFNKPHGVCGSREDGIRSLYSFVPNRRSWFTPAGVLRASASGVVILSNDKRNRLLDNTFTRLSQDVRAKVQGKVTAGVIHSLPFDVLLEQENTRSTWLTFQDIKQNLHNIAKALKSAGLEILSWERTRLGPFVSADLPVSDWRRISDQHIIALDYLVEHNLDQRTSLDAVWKIVEAQIAETP